MFELKLSLQEVNAVLGALAKGPFENVADLIGNIRMQAEPQIPRVTAETAAAATAPETTDEPVPEAAV